MTNEEIIQKIDKVANGSSEKEIFDRLRPPEEFGDAVELSFEEGSFKATVFDPQTNTVYSTVSLAQKEAVYPFIKKTVN